MTYKVIYHCGDEITIKTKNKNGRLNLTKEQMTISGTEQICIPSEQLLHVELFRQHGLGRMLKVTHTGGTIFLSVVRFCLFNTFAVINFFKTGSLNRELNEIIKGNC